MPHHLLFYLGVLGTILSAQTSDTRDKSQPDTHSYYCGKLALQTYNSSSLGPLALVGHLCGGCFFWTSGSLRVCHPSVSQRPELTIRHGTAAIQFVFSRSNGTPRHWLWFAPAWPRPLAVGPRWRSFPSFYNLIWCQVER